jgi:hypothetical protein
MKVVVSFAVAVLAVSTAHAELSPAAGAKASRVVTLESAERSEASAHSDRIAEDLERKVEALIEARVAEHLKSIAVEPELVARVD